MTGCVLPASFRLAKTPNPPWATSRMGNSARLESRSLRAYEKNKEVSGAPDRTTRYNRGGTSAARRAPSACAGLDDLRRVWRIVGGRLQPSPGALERPR